MENVAILSSVKEKMTRFFRKSVSYLLLPEIFIPFVIGIVISGEGFIHGKGFRRALRRGSEFFIPHGVADYAYGAGEAMRIIECYPPKADVDEEGRR